MRDQYFLTEILLNIGQIDRANYGYCIFQAARLAALLNYPRISVIEFGCGGGNGLINAEMHITEVMKIFAVDIELYGFDMGSGLPSPQDYRDIPHYFEAGLYEMDNQSLENKLKRAKLVIGNVTWIGRYFNLIPSSSALCASPQRIDYSQEIDLCYRRTYGH